MKTHKILGALGALLLSCSALGQSSAGTTFTVASLNVDGLPGKLAFFNVNPDGPQAGGSLRISQYLAQKGCDIICLQENFNYRWEIWSHLLLDYQKDEWTGGISLLGENIDYAHLQNWKYGCDGLNTLWKKGISSQDYVRTPWTESFGKFSHDFDDIITKGFRRHELTLADGHRVVVYNMHMDASSARDEQKHNDLRDRMARLAQWQQLAADIVARLDSRPVIVAGDMNSFYHRDDIKTAFIDAIEATGLATVGDTWMERCNGGSYPALGGERLDGEPLDKILYVNPTEGCQVTPLSVSLDSEGYTRSDGTPLGDHFPLIATFEISGDESGSADDDAGYIVQKISNPDRGERQVDGLIEGGDRENSYAWRMALRGDDIYIATTRNIASMLVNMYAPSFSDGGISLDTFWALIDAVTNGDIPRNDNSEGANIIAYNRTTGQFRVVYTAEPTVFFRMAVTFGDDVYFGSYSADPTVAEYILKLDPQGNFTKVFQTMGSVSLRANCVYDDHLFFAGADDREVVAEGDEALVAKMAVLRKSNSDDTVWERVADYRDFGRTAFDRVNTNWAASPIWELATHNGYIYATAPSSAGFVVYKGHPAADGEQANEYGWYWQEVAGPTNGVNNPGLSDQEGGEPGTMRSLIGSVYEFNGQLYAYNFDHAFGGEAAFFAGIIQQLAGQEVKASDYLFYMYNSLHNPQKIWKLNDETGKFEECKNFTRLTEGTTNEYIWRMGQYDGQLYISTMDAGIFYGYMTQLTNGSFLQMSAEERQSKLAYLQALISQLQGSAGELSEKLAEQLETLRLFLEQFLGQAIATLQSINSLSDVLELLANVQAMIDSYLQEHDVADEVASKLAEARQKLQELVSKIDVRGIDMYLYINRAVQNDDWGFDLYRTSDAEHFQAITRNGFNDKYNYGCPSFLDTEEGLYIGTCNPFYGGQLYLLTNQDKDPVTTGISTLPSADSQTDGQAWYSLDGRRLEGTPTAKGLYLRNGRKEIIK
ncbi:MAG: endonuclease/exonuclease/phosphatase family protein [Prevotella sp.]|nr:endonuclease/exonuclease/phosphatase family protein [Prevotella sp.]